MATGGSCVLALGERLFNIWLGRGNYIGPTIATIFFILQFFEVQSFIIITSSRATEDEAFAPLSVIAATLKIALSVILGKRFGLLGIAAGTLCAQFATSYWYMCYRGLQRLKMGLRNHIERVLLPAALLFFATLATVRGLSVLLAAQPDWMAVAAGGSAAIAILSAAIWTFVLDLPQRRFIFALPARLTGALLQGSD
jgi:O-antigen/teichoic acid export membrane protein